MSRESVSPHQVPPGSSPWPARSRGSQPERQLHLSVRTPQRHRTASPIRPCRPETPRPPAATTNPAEGSSRPRRRRPDYRSVDTPAPTSPLCCPPPKNRPGTRRRLPRRARNGGVPSRAAPIGRIDEQPEIQRPETERDQDGAQKPASQPQPGREPVQWPGQSWCDGQGKKRH